MNSFFYVLMWPWRPYFTCWYLIKIYQQNNTAKIFISILFFWTKNNTKYLFSSKLYIGVTPCQRVSPGTLHMFTCDWSPVSEWGSYKIASVHPWVGLGGCMREWPHISKSAPMIFSKLYMNLGLNKAENIAWTLFLFFSWFC